MRNAKINGGKIGEILREKNPFCQINFKTGKKKPIAVITKCNRFTANLPDQVWVCCVCVLCVCSLDGLGRGCYKHNVQHTILFGEAFLAAFYTATAMGKEKCRWWWWWVPPLLLLTAPPPGCASPC